MNNRQTKNFTLDGLDLSVITSKKVVCRELNNARYKDKSWRNSYEMSCETPITSENGFTILYKHQTTDSLNYIAERGTEIHHITITKGNITSKQNICVKISGVTPKISHFGNTIFFRYLSESPVREICYVFYQNSYILFDLNSITPLNSVVINSDLKIASKPRFEGSIVGEITVEDTISNKELQRNMLHSVVCNGLNKLDYITGSAYLFFGIRLFDGSIIKMSKMYMLPTEGVETNAYQKLSAYRENNKYIFYTEVSGCIPRLTIDLPDNYTSSPLIKSIVIYSSRDYPIYEYSQLELNRFLKEAETLPGNKLQMNRNFLIAAEVKSIFESPFYELKEIEIEEFENGHKEIKLTKNDYEDIEFKALYEPNFSVHTISSEGDFEYNSRLHKYSLSTRLYKGCSLFLENPYIVFGDRLYDPFFNSSLLLKYVVHLNCGNQQKTVEHIALYRYYRQRYSDGSGHSTLCYYIADNILSYPDSRAKRLEIYVCDINGNNNKLILSRTLKNSYELNISYHTDLGRNTVMHYNLIPLTDTTTSTPKPIDDILVEHNKLIVSNYANPFSFSPSASYYIGEMGVAKIEALSTTASPLSNESFGDYPLTAFTSEGIFVVEQGNGDILYSRIIKISQEKISYPTKPKTIGDVIFFCSSKGVMALSGRKMQNLSADLDNSLTNDSVKFVDYICGANISSLEYYNEVMIYNHLYSYAYILSLDNNMWSTRDFNGRSIGGNLYVCRKGLYDVSKTEDNNRPMLMKMATHLINITDIGYLRFEAMTFDIQTSGVTSYRIKIYGSNNLQNRYLIGSLSNINRLRRTAASWRYFSIEIECGFMESILADTATEHASLRIYGINVEFFVRFARNIMS